MIYLVTGQLNLFKSDAYKTITVEQSLEMMKDWKAVQYDSETDGRDAHINKILCIQFGNDAADAQIVVDTSSINILYYKEIPDLSTLLVAIITGVRSFVNHFFYSFQSFFVAHIPSCAVRQLC